MQEIKSFTPEVCKELKYYVYRLVDPRNGQTFYVGKGKNNRVFAHAECALKEYSDVDYNPDEDDEDNLKYKIIREIKRSGLDVIYIIQKYGLEESEAYLIESTLIDVYSIERRLTNKCKGYNSTEPMNAITLQKELCREEYIDSPNNPKYMIIKVKDYWLNIKGTRYDTTRNAWKINIDKARKYPYVLSVTNGIVEEIYKVNEWHYIESGRCEFTGDILSPNDPVSKLFLNKRIPAKYRTKGRASPCLYCKPNGD